MTAKSIGLDMNFKTIDMFVKNEHKEEWFLKMNPNHTVPTLDDNGFYLWESRAIMTYIVDKYAKNDSLYPKDVQKRAIVDQWMQFDLSGLYQAVCDFLFGPTFYNEKENPEKGKILKEKLAVTNKQLEGHSYVAGNNLTLADLCVLQSVATCEVYQMDMKPYPAINKWHAKLKTQLPFYEESMKEGLEELKKLLPQ